MRLLPDKIVLATGLTALVLFATLPAAPAAAKDRDDRDHTVTVINEDGQTYLCHFTEGKGLRVVEKDTGDVVVDLDLKEIGESVREAVASVNEALSDIDLNFRCRGDGHRVTFAVDDETVSVDVDAIMKEVGDALANLDEAFAEARVDHDRVRVDHDRAREDVSELKAEVDRLQSELKDLQRELREERRRAHR